MTAEHTFSASGVQEGGRSATDAIDDLYARGMVGLKEGDKRRALDEFEAVLAIEPGHALTTYQIGIIARDVEDFALAHRYFGDAIPLLWAAISENKGSNYVWLALLGAMGGLCRRDEMRKAAEAAVKGYAFDLRFQRDVAVRLLDHDIFDLAYSILQRCLDRGLKGSETHANLGIALCNLGREAEAITALEYAIELDPKTGGHYELLARIYRRDNLTADKAVAVLRRGLRNAPSQSLYTDLAGSLENCGRYEEAVEVLRAGSSVENTDDPSVSTLFALGKALSLAGKDQEANKVREHVLSKLGLLAEVGMSNDLVKCFEIDLLWSVGRHNQAMTKYRDLRGGRRLETYFFHPDQYSLDIPARLERLRRIIRKRDVFVFVHGPSVRDFEARISAFAGRDICFMTGHSFAFFETALLSKIERQVELVMVTNFMTMSRHYDQVQAYVKRSGANMLLTGRHCLDLCTIDGMDSAKFEQQFDDKLLIFPTPGSFAVPRPDSPLSFPIGNTLACMLPFLVIGEAKRVFIFGADGISRDATGGHLRYGAGHPDYRREPTDEHEGHMLAMNLLTDTLTFDHVAELSIQGASFLFDRAPPPIYNVSPHSHLGLFPKIDIDECIELTKP